MHRMVICVVFRLSNTILCIITVALSGWFTVMLRWIMINAGNGVTRPVSWTGLGYLNLANRECLEALLSPIPILIRWWLLWFSGCWA